MPLPTPNLDDRTFQQLLNQARQRIRETSPEWTDLSPGDPGMVLLELFAHLTEVMIYRLNRLPDKAYIEFLNLLGVQLQPPAAATVQLRFRRTTAAERPLEIPRGTRVTVERGGGEGDAPVFTTARSVTLEADQQEVKVLAYHAEDVTAEYAGEGTGMPGQEVRAQTAPLVAPMGDDMGLMVGVALTTEEQEQETAANLPVLEHQGQLYRVWREVENFSHTGPDDYVYVADRISGRILFAPAARQRTAEGLEESARPLAAVPQAGREIRLWYRHGGGQAGNVDANTLTTLKDPLRGVEVTNPAAATGGQEAETLQNALVRGPLELHALHRAVTARDFELVALTSARAVARAQALTRAALWAHATPGTVEVVLVPQLPEAQRERVTAEALAARQTETARERVQAALDARRPLGTSCVVSWAHCKTVRVTARAVVRRYEDQALIRERILNRLHQSINPLPTTLNPDGWPFGQALRASHVYDIALAESGVLWVDKVTLHVTEVPDQQVQSLAADAFQPHTWYAGSQETLFRSLDDGAGWEPVGDFAGESIAVVRPHPRRAGYIAAITELPEGGARIHISSDLGETWQESVHTTAFAIHDAGWLERDGAPVLLLATDAGLYELALEAGSGPVQILVDSADADKGFYAVTTFRDAQGRQMVALAAQGTDGVYLSSEGGQRNSFRLTGLQGEDVRVLEVQALGPRAFLWAGTAAAGGAPGQGCYRWELRGGETPPEGWESFSAGWSGGSCRALAFVESLVVAATYRAGVLLLDSDAREPRWEALDVRNGLPLRDPGRFSPLESIAATADGAVMVGGEEGVYLSTDEGHTYRTISAHEFTDRVTLPPTWLFCSGEHEVIVESEDEAQRD